MNNKLNVLAWPGFNYKTSNPYNWLLNTNLSKSGVLIKSYKHRSIFIDKIDIWHMHWPAENVISDSYFKTTARIIGFFILILVSKLRNIKLLWTAHNIKLHDKNYLIENLFYKYFHYSLDGIICLSEDSYHKLISTYPSLNQKPFKIIKHGHYENYYPNKISEKEARTQLGIKESAKIGLFIGQIREYKKLDILIDQFRRLDDENASLIIAGKPKTDNLKRKLIELIGDDKRIIFKPSFVKNEDFQLYFNASDFLIIPYKETLNSGIALLSLTFGLPIFSSKIPSIIELNKDFGDQLVCTYDELSISSLKKEYLKKRIKNYSIHENVKYNWNNIAIQTIEFYNSLIS